jgi:hypothetical protein
MTRPHLLELALSVWRPGYMERYDRSGGFGGPNLLPSEV